jgi:GH25 family lysozyme M1 (1,4-beta-N-acetylmuramidase)
MNQPYQIGLDIWEANSDLDVPILKDNDVKFMIVRLNSMSGGHHMDDRFPQNWGLSEQFECQTIYFVYNPWVTGKANFDWLIAHLPADFGNRRVMIDIEVKYPDYSPKVYAQQVDDFLMRLALENIKFAIYTGKWFLPTLSEWPADVDYWWGQYPYALTESTSWAQYKKNLSWVNMSVFTQSCPGVPRLWQCSGDGVRLEGFGNHAVDVNVFPGTLEELKAWMGSGGTSPIPQPERVCVIQSSGVKLRQHPHITGKQCGLAHFAGEFEVLDRAADPEGNDWVKVSSWMAERYNGTVMVRKA